MEERVKWDRKINKIQREEYTLENIFKGWVPACSKK